MRLSRFSIFAACLALLAVPIAFARGLAARASERIALAIDVLFPPDPFRLVTASHPMELSDDGIAVAPDVLQALRHEAGFKHRASARHC